MARLTLANSWLVVLCAIFLLSSVKLSAQGNGIGGYDLRSPEDIAVSFDYNSTGLADHILLYRPGQGVVYILAANNTGTFSTVFSSSTGIGGYDLKSKNDRILPFDYNGSGHADHLILYRPGYGIFWILANNAGTFTPVYQSSTTTSGVGHYDLMSTSDRLVAFDYDGSGLNDHILAYRPGTGTVYIIKNMGGGGFTDVFATSAGIGGWPLTGTADLLVPFDYYSIGSADHLLAYTPGTGKVSIIENQNGQFTSVYESTTGIGGYDLKSVNDRIIAYDYNGTGYKDHLIAYRPGQGIFWVMASSYLTFSAIVNEGTMGVAGFDFKSTSDRITVMNYLGIPGTLLIYRPGQGIANIATHNGTVYTSVYSSAYVPGFVTGAMRHAGEEK